jgi:hypothetical protein
MPAIHYPAYKSFFLLHLPRHSDQYSKILLSWEKKHNAITRPQPPRTCGPHHNPRRLHSRLERNTRLQPAVATTRNVSQWADHVHGRSIRTNHSMVFIRFSFLPLLPSESAEVVVIYSVMRRKSVLGYTFIGSFLSGFVGRGSGVWGGEVAGYHVLYIVAVSVSR